MVSLVVSLLDKHPVFCPCTDKYLHSLTVDLAVFYSIQFSHCVWLFFVQVEYKTSLGIYFWSYKRPKLETLCNSNKYFCLNVVSNIFLIIFAFSSNFLDFGSSGHLLFSSIQMSGISLDRLPLLHMSAGWVWFVWVGHSTTLPTLFLISQLLYLLQIVCKVLVCSTNAKLLYYLPTQWLTLLYNVLMQLLHFLLNLRPYVLRQVPI